jgi:hypothetical protein
MKRAHRAAIVVGSVSAAAAALMAAGIPAQAADAEAPDWQIVATVHYGAATNACGYSAVVALRTDDAWVFGGTNPGGPSSPTAENWDGKHWRASPLPPGLSGFIVAAAASSPRNVWAVGGSYALRWNGVKWSVARAWPQSGQLTSVAAINRDDVWVFGSSAFSGEASLGTWHYNGRDWIRATGLASAIYRASAVARHNIWGITVSPRGGWVAHYDGQAWERVRSADAALADTQLDNVLAVSRLSVWVSGITPLNGDNGRLVLAHWNGVRWKRFVSPWAVQQPERFASDGAGGIWIPVVSGGQDPATWMLHLSRAGLWTRVRLAAGPAAGVGVGDLALIPGTTSLWGSGGLLTTAGGDATIWAHLVLPVRWTASPGREDARASMAVGAGIVAGEIIREHPVQDHSPMVVVFPAAPDDRSAPAGSDPRQHSALDPRQARTRHEPVRHRALRRDRAARDQIAAAPARGPFWSVSPFWYRAPAWNQGPLRHRGIRNGASRKAGPGHDPDPDID